MVSSNSLFVASGLLVKASNNRLQYSSVSFCILPDRGIVPLLSCRCSRDMVVLVVPTGISGCFLCIRLAPQPIERSSHMREHNWGVSSFPRDIFHKIKWSSVLFYCMGSRRAICMHSFMGGRPMGIALKLMAE